MLNRLKLYRANERAQNSPVNIMEHQIKPSRQKTVKRELYHTITKSYCLLALVSFKSINPNFRV